MKINLASGQRPFPKPWVNVDIRKQQDDQGNDYLLDIESDIRSMPMIQDSSVDLAVGHHIWEHIPLHEQEGTVREWWRILKPGGKVLLCIPDMREIASRWIRNEIDTFTFAVNATGAFQGYITDLHRWEYDYQELVDRFSCWDGQVKKFPWETRRIMSLNELDQSLYQGADIAFSWWILIVEFTKV